MHELHKGLRVGPALPCGVALCCFCTAGNRKAQLVIYVNGIHIDYYKSKAVSEKNKNRQK